MSTVTEIADNVFRICTYVPEANIQFNQFLARDAEPLLYHTGHRRLFGEVREAVATLIDPATLRWIGFSHMEADECGALADWQGIAPAATALCTRIGKRIGVDDFIAARPARALADGERFATGAFRYRFLQTPQVPHGWDASLLFEETQGILFCSDLFHQNGDVEPVTRDDLVGRFRQTLVDNRDGPTPGYLPYTPRTEATLERLAALKPKVLAAMHGSAFVGNGERALAEAAAMMREVLA
ncbi:MAG: MBL fold metallo-hydrolase [Betaproteobacteria bacterium]|nr:MBL fold metallo-hydrolase [Betaproteobacteria bacterium]